MSPQSPTPEQIREEHQRIRYLRTLVDLTAHVIMQGRLSRTEALQLVEAMRRRILHLFPDKEQAYEIIYRPRFHRLVLEFTPGGEIIPFPGPRGSALSG